MNKPKETPILYTVAMVRAIFADLKHNTRRIIKPQPTVFGGTWYQRGPDHPWHDPKNPHLWHFRSPSGKENIEPPLKCPYGDVGDRLWVRETWNAWGTFDAVAPRDLPVGTGIAYAAGMDDPHGEACGKLRPSIFMPRWACRLVLEITGVKVERLQDISEEGAIAEGMEVVPIGTSTWSNRQSFSVLWDQINGKTYPWAKNPFVWVISFKRIKTTTTNGQPGEEGANATV